MNPRESGRSFPRRAIALGAVGAVLIAAVLVLAALRRPEGIEAAAARATRKDLVVPILTDGTLEPPAGGEVRSPERAAVASIRAREGERVRKGATLVELSDPSLATAAREARSSAEALVAAKARATVDLNAARDNVASLEKVVDADGRLLSEGAIPRTAYEADALALKQAREHERAAQAELDSLAGTSSRVDLARTSAEELERRAAALTVKAPTDGVVYGLPRRAGETIEAGQLVASIADPDHLRVRARVDQPDLPRVADGQRLIVTFDGLPDRRWDGRVTVVSPGLRDVGGRQVGEILGEIADPTSSLPPNASVNVSIIVAEKRSVLVVPRAAVQRDGEKRFLWVDRNGRARRVDVTLGVVGANEVEVVSGIGEGDTVLLPGSVPLSEAVRVSHRRA